MPGPLVRIATRVEVRSRLRHALAARGLTPAVAGEKLGRLSDASIDDAAEHVGVDVPGGVLAGGLETILQWFRDHEQLILAIVELLLPLLLAL